MQKKGQGIEKCSLFLNAALLSLIFLICFFAFTGNNAGSFITLIFLVFVVFCYLSEANCALIGSETLTYLSSTMDVVSASTLVRSLVDKRPAVVFRGGRGTQEFAFDSWRDTSKVFRLEQGAHRVGLRLKKSFTCEDDWTEQHFSRAFEEYKRPCDSDDNPMHMIELDGFVKGILVVDPEKPRPIAVGPRWCILFTMLGLSWPYRMYIRSIVDRKVEHRITKVIQVGQPRYIEHGQGHSPTAAVNGGTQS